MICFLKLEDTNFTICFRHILNEILSNYEIFTSFANIWNTGLRPSTLAHVGMENDDNTRITHYALVVWRETRLRKFPPF